MRKIKNNILLFLVKHASPCSVRLWALKRLGATVGKDVYLAKGLTLTIGLHEKNIQLRLAERVSIAPNVTLILASHPNNSHLKAEIVQKTRRISIGEDSWIGANTIILPDISIGKNCIVGAGSVITKNVPDGYVVAGNPAKIIRK